MNKPYTDDCITAWHGKCWWLSRIPWRKILHTCHFPPTGAPSKPTLPCHYTACLLLLARATANAPPHALPKWRPPHLLPAATAPQLTPPTLLRRRHFLPACRDVFWRQAFLMSAAFCIPRMFCAFCSLQLGRVTGGITCSLFMPCLLPPSRLLPVYNYHSGWFATDVVDGMDIRRYT